jgi:hypothetical protein
MNFHGAFLFCVNPLGLTGLVGLVVIILISAKSLGFGAIILFLVQLFRIWCNFTLFWCNYPGFGAITSYFGAIIRYSVQFHLILVQFIHKTTLL